MIAVLRGDTPAGRVAYRWEFHPEQLRFVRPPNDEDGSRCSPFFTGGYGIFRYAPTETGFRRFAPVYRVAKVWVPDVVPAIQYCKEHRELFVGPVDDTKLPTLEQMLDDKNSMLAGQSCRRLCESGEFRWDTVSGRLSNNDYRRVGMFVFQLLYRGGDESATKAGRELESLVAAAATQDSLRGIAIGCFASLFASRKVMWPPPTEKERPVEWRILKRIKSRTFPPEKNRQAADYVKAVFEATGSSELTK